MRSQAAHQVRLTLLGDCRLTIDGNLVQGVPLSFFRISAYLMLSGRIEAHPRQRLSALLWSDSPDDKAAANMRQSMARIRHLQDEQGFQLIEANFWFLHLVKSPGLQCDLLDLLDHLDGTRAEAPAQICGLYGGDLLAGLDEGSSGFEDWLATRREQLRIDVIEGMAGCLNHTGLSLAERAHCAHRLLDVDPYHEGALQVLMLEAAERRQILRLTHLYDAMRALLAEDLGIRPSRETQALYNELIEGLRAG